MQVYGVVSDAFFFNSGLQQKTQQDLEKSEFSRDSIDAEILKF